MLRHIGGRRGKPTATVPSQRLSVRTAHRQFSQAVLQRARAPIAIQLTPATEFEFKFEKAGPNVNKDSPQCSTTGLSSFYICCDSTSEYQLPVLNVNWTYLLEKIRVN